jgi:TetR/AcrR family transcriptional regulator, hemagglutinin/protease regulatory protein
MPSTPRRTRLAPDDRRAQLIGHALATFADHGIARATQAQVAARAGVSVSAVYSYFRTRADLVTAVLDAVETAISDMVSASLASPAPAPIALTRLATRTADMALDQPEIVRVWLDWSAGVRADTWPRFLLLQAQLHRQVETLFPSPADPADAHALHRRASAARLFVGCAHTLALMHFENIELADRALFIDQMVAGSLAAAAGPD